MANPALTDLSIEPNSRAILGLMQPDPQIANWSVPGFVQMMTAEGWLSTWSGLSTRVSMHEDTKKIHQPYLGINFAADVTILPYVTRGAYENCTSKDKEYVEIDADHFAFVKDGAPDRGFNDLGAAVTGWLKKRFPARA
jgi:hypothetical protein